MINYDVPHDSEDYVHRIGRTARANNDGVALTFVNEKEQSNFKQIENFLERDIYKIPVPEELGESPEYKPRSYDARGKRNFRAKGRKVVEMLRRKEMLQKEEVMLREKVLTLQEKATNKRRISLIDIV